MLVRPHRKRAVFRVDEVLLLAAAVGLAALLIHQLVTDGVCHGSCTLPLPTPSGRLS